jgi:hypothetical protein
MRIEFAVSVKVRMDESIRRCRCALAAILARARASKVANVPTPLHFASAIGRNSSSIDEGSRLLHIKHDSCTELLGLLYVTTSLYCSKLRPSLSLGAQPRRAHREGRPATVAMVWSKLPKPERRRLVCLSEPSRLIFERTKIA